VEEETLALLRRALLEEREQLVQQLHQLYGQLAKANFTASAQLLRADRDR